MYCSKCGKENGDKASFCIACGFKLDSKIAPMHTTVATVTKNQAQLGTIGLWSAIIGSIGFIISLLLRGTEDYAYGQYPWLREQASFAGTVDFVFYLSILAIAVGLVLVLMKYMKK